MNSLKLSLCELDNSITIDFSNIRFTCDISDVPTNADRQTFLASDNTTLDFGNFLILHGAKKGIFVIIESARAGIREAAIVDAEILDYIFGFLNLAD